jgi:hypothetical protein
MAKCRQRRGMLLSEIILIFWSRREFVSAKGKAHLFQGARAESHGSGFLIAVIQEPLRHTGAVFFGRSGTIAEYPGVLRNDGEINPRSVCHRRHQGVRYLQGTADSLGDLIATIHKNSSFTGHYDLFYEVRLYPGNFWIHIPGLPPLFLGACRDRPRAGKEETGHHQSFHKETLILRGIQYLLMSSIASAHNSCPDILIRVIFQSPKPNDWI